MLAVRLLGDRKLLAAVKLWGVKSYVRIFSPSEGWHPSVHTDLLHRQRTDSSV